MRRGLEFSVFDVFAHSGVFAFVELAVFVQVILFEDFFWRGAVRSARAAGPAETTGPARARTQADEFVGCQFAITILVEFGYGG